MPASRSRPRRLTPLLLAGLGISALLLVLWAAQGDGGWLASWTRAPATEGDVALLEAGAPAAEGRVGPRLEPTPDATPRATHGPVTVRVVDRAGRAVPGVRLEAWIAPEPAPTPTEPTTEAEDTAATYVGLRAVGDALGVARFDDLPYDGRARVRALARLNEEGDEAGATSEAAITAVVPKLESLPVLTWRLNPQAEGETGATPTEPRVLHLSGGVAGETVTADSQEAVITILDPPPADLLGDVVVEGPEATLVVEAGLPLAVEVREGGAGRTRRDASVRLRPRVAWEAPSSGETVVAVKRGEPATIACRVQAPDGWIARMEASWQTTIHPLAQRLVATYPLRPAIEVIVELPEQVMPYRAEDWAGQITVAGVVLERPDLHVDGRGHLHVRGGAHVVGDQVTVEGTLGTRFQVRGTGFIGADAREAVRIRAEVTDREARAADPESEPSSFVFSLEDGVRIVSDGNTLRIALGQMFRKMDFQRLSGATMAELAEEQERLAARRGGLSLRVVAWNGAPAAGARLRWGEQEVVADAQGRVRLEGVVDGPTEITLLGAGAPARLPLEVGAAPRAEMTIAAPQGGTLEVEVVDTEGRALPFAHVDVTLPHDLPHMDCVDGVQRIDPYTDAAGRRTYRFVTPGQVKVQAYFGTRNVETLLDVVDGATQPVRLVLPVRAPPPPPDTGAK